MDPLDDVELKLFEHLHCTHCAQIARQFLEIELIDGTIGVEDLKDLEIVVKDEY